MMSMPRIATYNIPQAASSTCKRLFCSSPQRQPSPFFIIRPRSRGLHATGLSLLPRKRDFFSTNSSLNQQQNQQNGEPPHGHQAPKKKSARSPAGKTSLRRVAVEAQRSRDGHQSREGSGIERQLRTKTVTAYCATERFDLALVVKILKDEGYEIDPFRTELYPQVVHIQVPFIGSKRVVSATSESEAGVGDVFIFPSGTVVAWALPDSVALNIVTKTLLPAAENPHLDELETEDLEYLEEPKRENSSIRGDTIILGTKMQASPEYEQPIPVGHTADAASQSQGASSTGINPTQRVQVDTILAKIAFSSGLARSTKLAVLETLLSNYFDSTRSIPTMLSRGSRLPFTRSFILRKTGQLLSVRAQLNLYSELTDSLPDLFWDSRHELGLEGYYDQVGRALDVGVRIKVLNEKMDYAQEIASVLRERLSEKHGLILEWMIIALITVEVGFEILRLWKERRERLKKENHE